MSSTPQHELISRTTPIRNIPSHPFRSLHRLRILIPKSIQMAAAAYRSTVQIISIGHGYGPDLSSRFRGSLAELLCSDSDEFPVRRQTLLDTSVAPHYPKSHFLIFLSPSSLDPPSHQARARDVASLDLGRRPWFRCRCYAPCWRRS